MRLVASAMLTVAAALSAPSLAADLVPASEQEVLKAELVAAVDRARPFAEQRWAVTKA